MGRHVITPLYACSYELSAEAYQTRSDELAGDGYRLVFVDGFLTVAGLRYGGIWLRDGISALTQVRDGLTAKEYQAEYDDLHARGYLLRGVTGLSAESGQADSTLAALWTDGSSQGYRTHHGMTVSGYQEKFDEYAAAGYQLIYVTGYAENDTSRYAAIWFTGGPSPIHARHNLPSEEYQSTYDDLTAEGYRIAHVNAHEAGQQTYFAGIWLKQDGYRPHGRHNLSLADAESTGQEFAGTDYRITSMSCYHEDGQDKFAGVWVPQSRTFLCHGRADASLAGFDSAVQAFMRTNTIPGAQLAVTRNNKLVLARGYSLITSLERPVEPTSLFRLASVSKTLTGAAIVRLVEDGALSLRDRVVDLIDLPGTVSDRELRDVRVEHLLYHVGGWDRRSPDEGGSGIDPMSNDLQIAADYGVSLPITKQLIIKWMDEKYSAHCVRSGHALDYTPGKLDGAVYSNYGYLLLGQIVEALAGVPYEDFVSTRLLAPLGIRRMRLGRTLLGSTLPDEVVYHSTKSSNFRLRKNVMLAGAPVNAMEQYGGHFSMENIAANGGWLGSAVDLVRFASTFDDPACPILSPASIATVFAKHAYVSAATKSFDACGWFVQLAGDHPGQVKTGSFAGTNAMLDRWQDTRTSDRFTAALLFNKDEGDADWDLIGLVRDAAKGITAWPNSDYWSEYF